MDVLRVTELLRDCLAGFGDNAEEEVEFVDCHVVVAVVREKALEHRAEIIALVEEWMQETSQESINGQDFITAGAALGSQHHAITLFAVGKFLGLWDVVTPKTEGLSGDEANRRISEGFIVIVNSHLEPN